MLRLLLLLISLAGAVLVLTALTSKLYRIPTSSMEPTLHCGQGGKLRGCRGDESDRIAVSRVVYKLRDPKRGDIVAYKLPARGAQKCGSQPGSTFVHRIAGIPGDPIPNRRKTAIPADRYFVVGDNKRASCDSRIWGLLPRKRIIGPKIATYWPLDRISVSIG